MKQKLKVGLLLLIAGLTPTLALAGDKSDLKALAEMSGLSERKVRMLFASAPSSFAEYCYAYGRTERKFIEAVGREHYREMLAGKPVRLERQLDGKTVAFVVQMEPRS